MLVLGCGLIHASPNKQLHYGAKYCKKNIVKKAMSKGANINTKSQVDEFGLYPLHVAVVHQCTELVRYLAFKAKADIDVRDDYDATPLHLAAYHKQSAIFWLLIKAGADPLVEDYDGLTPKDIAEHFGFWYQ